MLMRVVVFDASGVLEAFDFRSVLIHKQEIQANQKLKLPFTEKNFFKFNNAIFGVCEGVGDLDYRDYPKNLNFSALLEYKARYSNKEILRADTYYPSSKTCSNCQKVKQDLTLEDRIYQCLECGFELDRDINAAINLLKHLVGRVTAEFTPMDLTALLNDLSNNRLATSKVELGIQQKSQIERIL